MEYTYAKNFIFFNWKFEFNWVFCRVATTIEKEQCVLSETRSHHVLLLRPSSLLYYCLGQASCHFVKISSLLERPRGWKAEASWQEPARNWGFLTTATCKPLGACNLKLTSWPQPPGTLSHSQTTKQNSWPKETMRWWVSVVSSYWIWTHLLGGKK